MIKFRPHSKEDIPFRFKWLNDKKVVNFIFDNFKQPTTLAKQKLWFKNYENNPCKKFFTILDDDNPIGFMGLSKIDTKEKRAEVFILIGEGEYRGKGVGRISMNYLIDIAFKELRLKHLALEVNKLNNPAIKLYQSLGFQKTKENDREIEMIFHASNLD